MEEEWRAVVGFEGHYEVSSKGRIKTLERLSCWNDSIGRSYKILLPEKIRDCSGTPHKYTLFCFRVDGVNNPIRLHRVVAEAFIPNPQNMPQVNHIDGNKSNNAVENLEWCTARQNNKHARNMGLIPVPKGEGHPNSKLSESSVRNIFHLHNNGVTITEISKMYGVTFTPIKLILKGMAWKHVNLEENG